MTGRIMIAIDGSDPSFEAVRYASKMLDAERTEIRLFCAIEPGSGSSSSRTVRADGNRNATRASVGETPQGETIEAFLERSRRFLDEASFREDAVVVPIRESRMSVAEIISSEAMYGCDGIMLGRRGMARARGAVMGEVPNALLNSLTDYPLWVVGGCPSAEKVIIPMDDSENARRALDYARDVFGSTGASFLLFRVIGRGDALPHEDADMPGAADTDPGSDGANRQSTESANSAAALFGRYVERLEERGVSRSRIMVKAVPRSRDPAEMIVEEARQNGYHTVIIGKKGITRDKRYYTGSVCSRVLQLADKETVVVVS